jgi:3'(2'), 5'-bisphosphate nucleotidase
MIKKVEHQKIVDIAISAGNAIMEIYNSNDFNVEMKSDNSPLTEADKVSHYVIRRELLSLYPHIPILSEEGNSISYDIRKNWKQFWLIDPLDGTKEFIKKNGEFTVNIALIENNEPVLGVIYAPSFNENSDYSEDFAGTLYFGSKEMGSFKRMPGGNIVKLPCVRNAKVITAVRSRSHAATEEERILKLYDVSKTILIGSSLKFCIVAEGKAQIYYRFGPTSEWDVAAGYAIAKYAGANIEGLTFNKVNLINDTFLVINTRS